MPPHEELVIELCVPCTRYPNREPKNEPMAGADGVCVSACVREARTAGGLNVYVEFDERRREVLDGRRIRVNLLEHEREPDPTFTAHESHDAHHTTHDARHTGHTARAYPRKERISSLWASGENS